MHNCSIHYPIIQKLNNKIIVSSQAAVDEPFYNIKAMDAMVESVVMGGAGGLRLAGSYHIKEFSKKYDLPIIGITKPDIIPTNYKDIVYITTTFEDAKNISDAGCNIIAIDATPRPRPKESLQQLIIMIHEKLNKPVMADISTLEEGIKAVEYGADIVSTTLSGYTSYTTQTLEPDFLLLEQLVNQLNIPVILEGRVDTVDHIKKAFDLGAYAVVVGSAITRPHLITRKFVEAINQ